MEGDHAFRELPMEPRGIFWQDDFIQPEHEQRLLDIFRHELEWPLRTGGASRLSLHYGYTFDYKTFGVDLDVPYRPFPDWLAPLIPTTEDRPPDQVCLQHYPPGAGIPPHADAHGPYRQLYALSLGSPVVMQFRKGDKRADVDLAPRSMMHMTGEARLHWTHGIKNRKTDTLPDGTIRPREDRWSITYRWIREGGQCDCGDVDLCDVEQRRLGIEKEKRWKKGIVADDDAGVVENRVT
ncbi:2OG-Fe(II) oxygenase [Trichoderma barbatum]